MNKQLLIEKTVNYLKLLPNEKITEVAEFVEYLHNKYETHSLKEGIKKIVSNSESFKFLENEEDLYSAGDIKERYR